MINAEQVLKRAGHFYAKAKANGNRGTRVKPEIISDQVKCAVRALVEDINNELQKLAIRDFQKRNL